MLTLVAIFHMLAAFGLIFLVLIQDPKGGAMGVFGAGGGSSNSFFGSTGATSFLAKATRWLAILFATCCLLLAYLSTHKGSSVMDQLPAAASIPGAPALPPPAAAPAQAPTAAPATPAAEAPKAPAETQTPAK